MVFKFTKFHVIDMGARRTDRKLLEQITFGDGKPPISDHAKVLGVFIDAKMTFKPHIKYVITRMGSVVFKLRKLAGTRAGISPAELYNVFKSYIFPRGDYASCIWIFRVFLPYRRTFYKQAKRSDTIFHISLKPMHGYGKHYWNKLNALYMDCMCRVIGVHKSTSHVGILVRMGVFPL